MTTTSTIDNATGQPVVTAAQLDGVRTARLFAFFIDYALILLLSVPFAVVIFFLGIITLGLAWGLYALLLPLIAIIYLAKTMGGPAQATPGMQIMDIQIKRLDGARVDPFLAILHGILFWVIHTAAAILPLFVTFFSSKKRLIHDILLGTYVSRSS